MKIAVKVLFLLHLVFLSFLFHRISCVTDTITVAKVLRDNETIVSDGGNFELGFFIPGNPSNKYVGIRYNNIKEKNYVWVANREVPLNTPTGFLEVNSSGVLVLRNEMNIEIWSSSNSRAVKNPVVQLLDDGNLVVKDANDDNPEDFLWQSFDYPSNTFLPGMKLGWNFITGREVYVSSWKSSGDPSPGDYTYRLDHAGYPQKMITMENSLVYRTGPWNGHGFNGVPGLIGNNIFSFEVVLNKKEVFYRFKLLGSTLSRFTLGPDGVGIRWTWDNQSTNPKWEIYLSAPADKCDSYGTCGSYGNCKVDISAFCDCLDKFEPKNRENWDNGVSSDGCIRRTPLNCSSGSDGFRVYHNLKLPNVHNSTFSRNVSLDECGRFCLSNCNCTAYSSLDISNGDGGCLLWFGDLMDMKESSVAGADIYIRLASSELVPVGKKGDDGKKERKLLVMVLLPSALIIVLSAISLIFYIHRKKKHLKIKLQKMSRFVHSEDYTHYHDRKEIELPLFELSELVKATNNFASRNKVGEGGFGPVYRGRLEEGQEIAVKRLSAISEQGNGEFENESICIARLQHRNLVRLLGCCVEGKEKILVYEYLSNRSLDYFIFDEKKSSLLDWPKRLEIIQGISRGLLYLHRDSRLRVVHRDLKPGNILLDAELNPKISDFGTAKSFRGNEPGDNTTRIVGTQGYMSPEYAGGGIFSRKSDVFSFGVILLEIVSGKRNKAFYHGGHLYNLLGHAWMLNREGRALELVDTNMTDSYCSSEMHRVIQIGLLCVQQAPEDRPDMAEVDKMLGNEGLPREAAQPGFFLERCIDAAEITITMIEAR